MKRFIMLAEAASQADLFLRFAEAAVNEGYSPMVITAKRSIAMRCKATSVPYILVRVVAGPSPDLGTTGDVRHGLLDVHSAQRYYASFSAANSLQPDLGVGDVVVVWGGGDTVASRALMDAAAQHGCSTLYCDRTNIPGRLFADPLGTNFNSLMFKNMVILDKDEPDEAAFAAIRLQLQQHRRAPETNGSMQRVRESLLDRVFALVNGMPYRGVMPWTTNSAAVLIRSHRDAVPVEGSTFVFLPLIDSFELSKEPEGMTAIDGMVREASNISQQYSAELVVKFHPAERDKTFVDRIVRLRREYRFRIVTEDALVLRTHACALAAPNTSIALAAMIDGTPVHHIGRTIFGSFDRRRLVNFVTRYLLPIDPSDRAPISTEAFRMIVQRAQMR